MMPRWAYALLLALPAAVVLAVLGAPALAIFPVAAIALAPSAYLMTTSTEALAERAGPTLGGLLSVTFGNGPELILTFISLTEGLVEVVKATLVGSIVGNVLLNLGGAMLVGGWRRPKQRFNRTAVQAYSGMLLLGTGVLLLPTIVEVARGAGLPSIGDRLVDFPDDTERISIVVAVILILSYAAGLAFSLKTHRAVFEAEPVRAAEGVPPIGAPTVERAHEPATAVLLAWLAGASLLVAVASDLMVSSVPQVAAQANVSQFFIGIVILGPLGNVAEYLIAIRAAARDDMALTLGVALGAGVQIALLVAPLLVLASLVLTHRLSLVFNAYEAAALVLSVLVANHLTIEGESNWFEGVQLLALFASLCAVFLII